MEDFALRYTARRARRWSYGRVANTALGSISFLALEAIGGAITLTYGFTPAVFAIMLVGVILVLTGLPIAYYAARYGVDIDLLTRGGGFGYIGSTITSLIYASFTFLFFALEAAILSFALEFCFAIPLPIGYLVSALVVIPLVMNGFSKISAFQAWTQPLWIALHLFPFVALLLTGIDFDEWTGYAGAAGHNPSGQLPEGPMIAMIGAAAGVALSLIAQIGEQVDFLRFLPEPKTKAEKVRWWSALLAAGPGWAVLGVAKMLAGSFLVVFAVQHAVPVSDATDPTQMYHAAFEAIIPSPTLALVLTGAFVILSQMKINVTNAYAGSIAWSNFFSRLTHSHPGRVVWLVFNVAIALLLMELGVFHALEKILGLYAHVALAWIGALTADLVVNKPLGLSPKGIEFRRAHLYDVNPVGTGAMACAVLLSLVSYSGAFGSMAEAYSAVLALATAFVMAPLIAWGTKGKYYLARPVPELKPTGGHRHHHEHGKTHVCTLCDYRFDTEDMTFCPFYAGPICSLCCTLDASCRDSCKPHARLNSMAMNAINGLLPARIAQILMTRMSIFLFGTAIPTMIFGALLLFIRTKSASAEFDAILTIIFSTMLVIIGIVVWTLILAAESRHKARDEADLQAQRLMREIRAHERTDAELQAAKEKAEAANLAKTRYMAGISHELRTPLNAIYGFAQILENAPDIPPARADAVRTIRRGSEHLAGLIENLLDISKIEAGRLEIHRDRIHLASMLSQVGAIFERQAREKGLEFGIRTTGQIPDWVDFDEKRLRQIIINLLSNAIRYTDRGSVTLHLHYRNEIARIEVSDTGQGIPAEDIDRIWSPFERLSQKSGGGSGLGLTITRLLVDILGGDITVDSAVDEGSTFTVKLMLPSVVSAFARPAPDRAAKPLPSGYKGARRTIMVVDDDLDHLRLMETILRPIGFLVHSAPNAQSALELLDDVKPDLFLLDIDMPGQSGWDLAKVLRQTPETRSTPIVMVSGHALEARQPVEHDGLYDTFVVKPFSMPDLIFRLGGLLRVDFTSQTTDVDTLDASPLLSGPLLARLRELVSIGHAAGVKRELARLENIQALSPTQLAALRARLEEFDMQGLLRIIEGMTTHAA